MEYSAENALGGGVKTIAYGEVHGETCDTILIGPGL